MLAEGPKLPKFLREVACRLPRVAPWRVFPRRGISFSILNRRKSRTSSQD